MFTFGTSIRVCATALAFAATVAAQDVRQLEQVVQPFTTDDRFMGAILVARGDEVLLSKGYGFANLEWRIPNTAETRFRIASITKQFTAAAILLLEERGRLSVTDPIRRHLPESPPVWEHVTIEHLVTHTSGIPNFTAYPDYPSTKSLAATPQTLIDRFRDRPLGFTPGEGWNYSNSGYILLGHLIERISGKSYAEFLQENVFAPLGMADSGYDSYQTVLQRRASGYQRGASGLVNATFLHMTIPYAAGGLYSTTRDLWRWNQALFGGKLLSPASLTKMTTARNGYAFGLYVRASNGRTYYTHSGGIDGFNTFLAYYPATQITVAVLANVNGPAADDLGARLAAVAHGDQTAPPNTTPGRN